jgi:hypothetical protein
MSNTNLLETLKKVLTAYGTHYYVKSEVDSKDSNVQNTVTSLVTNTRTQLQSNIDTVSSNLTSEVTRATGVEGKLSQDIGTVASDLSDETTRATGVEDTLSTQISDESSRAIAKENSLESSITNEVNRATTKEGLIVGNLNAEITRATNAETALGNRISTETTNRTNAINDVISKIQSGEWTVKTKNATDGIVWGIEFVTKAQYEEIDPKPEHIWYIIIDDDTTTVLANRISTLSTALNNEITRAKGEESSLNTKITTETSNRQSADSTLQDNIDAEETRATTAESALGTRITNEHNANETAHNTLSDAISTEETRAKGVEASLSTSISNEATTRANADSTLQDNIDAEGTARQQAVSTINSALGNLQQQIDNINHSQNFAGFVQHYSDLATATDITENDYYMVLQDETKGDAQTIYQYKKIDGVLTWDYVGKAANDTYTKEELDIRYTQNTTFNSTISTINSTLGTHTSDINTLESDLADEVSARQIAITDVNNAIAGKQDTLTTAQLNAVNSGITSALVTVIGNNSSAINSLSTSKQDKLTTSQLSAVNSGVTSTTVNQVATNKTNITSLTNSVESLGTAIDDEVTRAKAAESALQTQVSSKQDKLSTPQLNAVNSGATSTLIGKISTNESSIDALDTRVDKLETDVDSLQTALGETQMEAVNSGINSTLVAQISTNQSDIATLNSNKQNNLTTPQLNAVNSGITQALVTKIGTTETKANTNEATLAQEVLDRTDADTALGTRITNEATARQDADTTLQGNIDALDSKIDDEVATLNTSINTKQAKLTNPQLNAVNSGITSALVTKIGTNESAISAEATARANADTTLQTNINAEATARANLLTSLQNGVYKLKTKNTIDGRAYGVELVTQAQYNAMREAGTLDTNTLYHITDDPTYNQLVTDTNTVANDLADEVATRTSEIASVRTALNGKQDKLSDSAFADKLISIFNTYIDVTVNLSTGEVTFSKKS